MQIRTVVSHLIKSDGFTALHPTINYRSPLIIFGCDHRLAWDSPSTAFSPNFSCVHGKKTLQNDDSGYEVDFKAMHPQRVETYCFFRIAL